MPTKLILPLLCINIVPTERTDLNIFTVNTLNVGTFLYRAENNKNSVTFF